jgi:hypothetical protein
MEDDFTPILDCYLAGDTSSLCSEYHVGATSRMSAFFKVLKEHQLSILILYEAEG